ncbi:MAG: FHA domain-containing protein [Lachnospiraceae bacterium]
MNRSARIFRVLGSILVLLNLIAFFLPLVNRVQENYGELAWTQLDYFKCMLSGKLPGVWVGEGIEYAAPRLWIVCLILLPLFLSVIAGIWGIVGNERQKGSSILIFAVFALYIVMAVTYDIACPVAQSAVYSRGIASVLNLVFSGCATLMSVLALVRTPKKINVKKTSNIPQVREIKQQQVEAKYNIIMEEANKNQNQEKPYVPGEPRGVMVGLKGMYAGFEVPLNSGEYIRMGRAATNHLVFDGQNNVSRNHCKIKWDAERKIFLFCDYSTNGTFANGSEDCLPQNLEMEMAPGTVIALGDDTNTFRLE